MLERREGAVELARQARGLGPARVVHRRAVGMYALRRASHQREHALAAGLREAAREHPAHAGKLPLLRLVVLVRRSVRCLGEERRELVGEHRRLLADPVACQVLLLIHCVNLIEL